MISSIFRSTLYLPALNAIFFIAWVFPGNDLGLSIILLTLLVNLLLLPVLHKAKLSQRKMQEVEPEIKRIKSQLKNKREEQARKIMEVYKKHNINPFSSLLIVFIQFPIIIALFRVFQLDFSTINPNDLYAFIPYMESINTVFLGFFDLAKPHVVLALTAAVAQFFQAALMMPSVKKDKPQSQDIMGSMQKSMKYFLPVFIFVLGLKFPSALALYWTTMSAFGIVHEGMVRRMSRTVATGEYGAGNKETGNSSAPPLEKGT